MLSVIPKRLSEPIADHSPSSERMNPIELSEEVSAMPQAAPNSGRLEGTIPCDPGIPPPPVCGCPEGI
jgi:hypothetical protein